MKISSLFCLYFFLMTSINAQENHYWAQQFGARSSLLGGAVIGGVRDNSAIFYNPAAIAFIEHQGLTVNANAYKFDAITIKNGAGKGLDVPSNRFSLFPQLVSGTKSFKKNERLRWGYTLLTRSQANIRMRIRHEALYNVIQSRSGLEEFIGTYQNDVNINELWAGLGLAYKISNYISLGITQFLSYRNQVVSVAAERHALPSVLVTGSSFFDMSGTTAHSVLMNNFSILWKVGLAIDFDRFKAGLAITSPSVNLLGFGDVQREIANINMAAFQANNVNRNFLGTAGQKVSKITFKTPLSVALGLEYHLPNTKLMVATEYFAEIGSYKVMEADAGAFLRPSNLEVRDGIPNASDFLSVSTYARALVNYGIGIERKISKKYSLLMGFRTDYDSYERNRTPARNIDLSTTFWNLYHISGGLMMNRENGNLSIGLNYAYSGSTQIRQFVNYVAPQDTNALLGVVNNSAVADVNSFNIVVGFTYFLDKGK